MNAISLQSIDELDLFNKRVIIRVDYNVPYDDQGNITDYFRIEESLRTINYCIAHKAKSIVLISHRGRPGGKYIKNLSMEKVAKILGKLLQINVIFLPDPIPSRKTEICCQDPKPGSIIVLENLRFELGEEKNGKDWQGNRTQATQEEINRFRRSLRKLADVYINDAFGTVHRDHSSMMAEGFKIRAAGFLMKSELVYLSAILNETHRTRPLVCILGGNKCEEKIPLINNMLDIADEIIIGGGQAYNFLKVIYNISVGDFRICPQLETIIRQIVDKARRNNVKLHIPCDFIITNNLNTGHIKIADLKTEIKSGWIGVDIGPKTTEVYKNSIANAKVILWNGAMGAVKYERFSKGTKAVLNEVLKATKNGAITVAGGGRTGYCLKKWNSNGHLTHVSTGGCAFLKILEGKTYPAIKVLLK